MNREETRKAAEIMLAYADGKDIEFSDRWAVDSISLGGPRWSWDCFEYRLAVTPDVHQWDLYPDWVMYAARNSQGMLLVFEKDPEERSERWDALGAKFRDVTGFKTYTQGTCDWKDSKQKRPEPPNEE